LRDSSEIKPTLMVGCRTAEGMRILVAALGCWLKERSGALKVYQVLWERAFLLNAARAKSSPFDE